MTGSFFLLYSINVVLIIFISIMAYEFPNPDEFKGIYHLPFFKSIIVNELYEVVLKEAGFDEWGQPKRNCPTPDIDSKELEQRAWELYKKEGAMALPDDGWLD